MICTKCGKGELQELTGTEMLICPLCSCKLISPNAHKYVPQFQTDGWTDEKPFKVMRFPHEEAQTPDQANNEQNPMMPTIHLSGDYGASVSEAAQIIFHKYKDGKLGIEIYPTEELANHLKMNSPISFNVSPIARAILMRFLNNTNGY